MKRDFFNPNSNDSKKYFKNGFLYNPNYEKNRYRPALSSEEIKNIEEEFLLFSSVNCYEFECDLILDLLEYYNLENEEHLMNYIIYGRFMNTRYIERLQRFNKKETGV